MSFKKPVTITLLNPNRIQPCNYYCLTNTIHPTKQMNSCIDVSTCCECDKKTYHIPLPTPAVTFESDEGFHLHLDELEVMSLCQELKNVLQQQAE